MSYEIKLLEYDELPKDEKDMASEEGWGELYLGIFIDGELTRVYSDGMEPEDASFGRNLGWVIDEIKRAYEKGREDKEQDYIYGNLDRSHI